MNTCFLLFCILIFSISNALDFSYVTGGINLKRLSGDLSIAAVADLNSDRYSDLLLVNKSVEGDNDELIVLLWNNKNNEFKLKYSIRTNVSIVSASTADFDGDGKLDAFVLSDSKFGYYGYIFWGGANGPTETHLSLEEIFQVLPLIMDFNGDHLLDILATTKNILTVWICDNENRTFTKTNFPTQEVTGDHKDNTITALDYIDINSDCLADILITRHVSGEAPVVSTWLKDSKSMNFTESHSFNLSILSSQDVYGPPGFRDMNGDGQIDMVIMSCNDTTCLQPQVHVLIQRHNSKINVLQCKTSSIDEWTLEWATVSTFNLSRSMNPLHVISYRPVLGDLDLDGYPDLILITTNSSTPSSQSAVIMMNTRTRRFREVNVDVLSSVNGVVSALFIDFWEDGILDVLLTKIDNDTSRFVALRQTFSKDHMFLKALVLSGFCCKGGHQPFGSILPGAVVSYETQDRNGNAVKGMGSCSVGSSYLHNPTLPYVVLGLGGTSNFISKLTIGLSHDYKGKQWYRQWELLVPNSQVILIPKPPHKPPKWTLQLYLTPSDLIYSVSGVLLGICVGILIIIMLLHAREKYQDSKERKQAKQRFHFNVM